MITPSTESSTEVQNQKEVFRKAAQELKKNESQNDLEGKSLKSNLNHSNDEIIKKHPGGPTYISTTHN